MLEARGERDVCRETEWRVGPDSRVGVGCAGVWRDDVLHTLRRDPGLRSSSRSCNDTNGVHTGSRSGFSRATAPEFAN